MGAGKTTLCRVLLNQLDEKTEVAFVLNSYLTEFELLKTINEDLGLSTTGRTRKELIDELNKFLVEKRENGGNVAVIHRRVPRTFRSPCWEQLRMLSNIETEKEKLLQIILVGQPELKRRSLEREDQAAEPADYGPSSHHASLESGSEGVHILPSESRG